MKVGTEDKKKVAIFAALLAIIIPLMIWELHGTFATPPAPRVTARAAPAQRRTAPAASAAQEAAAAPEAQKIDSGVADPTLHLSKLAQSEDVEYHGTGRNIFSADSAPVIPQPVKSPRANNASVTVPTAPVGPPQPPPIDLKYFGYEQPKDKGWIRAFLVHGDDIFVAQTGEIVDHRYKITNISPSGIQVTDLAYNHTQTLPLMQ